MHRKRKKAYDLQTMVVNSTYRMHQRFKEHRVEQTKDITLEFGKFKGKKLVQLPGWYLYWLAYNAHEWIQIKYPSVVHEAERIWHLGLYEG